MIVALYTSSPVAQLVEQVAVNHPVAGSSPARGAILESDKRTKKILRIAGFFLVNHVDYQQSFVVPVPV